MHYRTVGRSGLIVSEQCLGAMLFGEASERGVSPEDARRIIDQFIDAGGNYIDTANVYAGGRSEEIVGDALVGRRDQIVVATKVRFQGADPTDNAGGLSRGAILAAVDSSLRRLATDYIDLYYLHGPDPLTPIEETLAVLDDIVRAGKVRYLGLSNYPAWQAAQAAMAGPVRFVAAQYQYSLVCRDIEHELVDMFDAFGLGLHPWGPLGGGFLSGKYRSGVRPEAAGEGRLATASSEQEEYWDRRATDRNWRVVEAVDKVAAAHDATASQVALAWLGGRTTVTSVILGVRTAEQLADNLGAAAIRLSADELRLLDDVSRPDQPYPYRMLDAYAQRRLG